MLVLLCASSSLLPAQTVTEIDTRGKTESKPANRIAGGFLKGLPPAAQRTGPVPIEVALSLADPSKIKYGKKFDYTLTITNKTDRNIKLPRSLAWSDVADTNKKEQTYMR